MRYLILVTLLLSTMLIADEITIYNSNHEGFALIHDTVEMQLDKGINDYQLQDVTEQINVKSLILQADKGVELLIQDYKPNMAKTKNILRHSLNQNIIVTAGDHDPIEGKLVFYENEFLGIEDIASSQMIILRNDKIIALEFPEFKTKAADLKPALNWKLYSPAKQNVELDYSYLTSDFDWEAIYNAVWYEDKNELQLNSQVVISNYSGKDFLDCQIKLVAGDINLYQNVSRLVDSDNAMMAKEAAFRGGRGVKEASLYDFHLYTLPQNIDLPDSKSRQVQLYPAAKITARKYFIYNTYSTEFNGIISFNNSEDKGFGKPLPQGMLKLYTPEKSSGITQFVGDVKVKRSAVDVDVKLQTGSAFDLKGETLDLKLYTGSRNETIAKDIQVTLWNNSDKEAEVIIQHYVGNLDEIYNTDFEYQRIDQSRIEFTVFIKAHSQKEVTWSQKK
jgi:hypothetical protein